MLNFTAMCVISLLFMQKASENLKQMLVIYIRFIDHEQLLFVTHMQLSLDSRPFHLCVPADINGINKWYLLNLGQIKQIVKYFVL